MAEVASGSRAVMRVRYSAFPIGAVGLKSILSIWDKNLSPGPLKGMESFGNMSYYYIVRALQVVSPSGDELSFIIVYVGEDRKIVGLF